MTNPILKREELSRLPVARRPIAEPGTTLVYQSRRGELASAGHGYTTGEVWWRGPRTVYTVDTRRHGGSFSCRLPTKGDALYFDAAVSFTWSVYDALIVVRDNVTDAAGSCQQYLTRRLPDICRSVEATAEDAVARAERAIRATLGQSVIRLTNGLSIAGVHASLSLDAEQAVIAKELTMETLRNQRDVAAAQGVNAVKQAEQEGELRRKRERISFYEELVGNKLLANILAEDPSKATETAQMIFSMEQQQRDKAIQAMQVIIDGGQLQIGDLDPAISAVVTQFTKLVSHVGSAVGGAPLTGGAREAIAAHDGGQPAVDDAPPDGTAGSS